MDPTRRSAIARGMKAATIDATVLRELLAEAHAEAAAKYLADAPATFVVGMDQAILRLKDRSRVVKYHRPDCRHLSIDEDRLEGVSPEQCLIRGYDQCTYCSTLSMTEWSLRVGLDPSTVAAIIRKDKLRVRKRNAVKIFRAIGEEPHPSLLSYEQVA